MLMFPHKTLMNGFTTRYLNGHLERRGEGMLGLALVAFPWPIPQKNL
jgi:hypothetical protein